MLAARARAVLDGLLAPSIDDVLALAHPVLRHRMALNFAARAEGVALDSVIVRLCAPHRSAAETACASGPRASARPAHRCRHRTRAGRGKRGSGRLDPGGRLSIKQ